MNVWIGRLLVAVWLLCGVVTPAAAKRVALIMGNSDYAIKPLQNPTNDATAIAAAFRALGFDHVTLHTDLTRRRMVEALQAFEGEAAGADVAVVFFAGHGTALEQVETYLVPVDAKLAREADLDDEAVSLRSVLRRLDGTTGLRLVILDACRNPPFALAGRKRAATRGLNRVEPDDNTLVAYATKDGATADDGAGAHSPFTTALLSRIATPGIDISFVFRQVRDDVLAATGRQQQPHVYGTLGATPIYLNPDNMGAAAAVAAAAPIAVPTGNPAPVDPGLPDASLVSAVQTELKRVGCYTGAADGKWGGQSTAALARLHEKLGTSTGQQHPTKSLLIKLEELSGRVCPLACDVDEQVVGGLCVAKPVTKKPTAEVVQTPAPRSSAGVGNRPAAYQYSYSIWPKGSIKAGSGASSQTPYGGLTCSGGGGGGERVCRWN
jgi:hypothetical protein